MILVGIICMQNKLARMRANLFFCYIKIIFFFLFVFSMILLLTIFSPLLVSFYSYCWLITTRVLAKNGYMVILSI